MIITIIKNTLIKSITNIERSSNMATITTSTAHNFSNGDFVEIACSDSSYDAENIIISNVTSNTFDYENMGSDESIKSATGTVGKILTCSGIEFYTSFDHTLEEYDRDRMIESSEFDDYLNDGSIVINNGTEDLSYELGRLNLRQQIRHALSLMRFIPGVGINAPTLTAIGPTVGQQVDIGNEIYMKDRVDGLAGKRLWLEFHFAIDNNTTDRWITFELSILTFNGSGDKTIDTSDAIFTIDPSIEVSDTPYEIFKHAILLPTSLFENDEEHMHIKIKRVTASGKTSPDNDPIVLAIHKRFYQRLD